MIQRRPSFSVTSNGSAAIATSAARTLPAIRTSTARSTLAPTGALAGIASVAVPDRGPSSASTTTSASTAAGQASAAYHCPGTATATTSASGMPAAAASAAARVG